MIGKFSSIQHTEAVYIQVGNLKSRINQAKIFLITTVAVLIAGCDMEFSALPNEPILLAVNRSGVSVYERQLDAADPVRLAINRWFAENPYGWEYAYRHRSPHILLTGNNFSVNILEDEVTVKYCHGPLRCHLWVKENKDLFPEINKLIQPRLINDQIK